MHALTEEERMEDTEEDWRREIFRPMWVREAWTVSCA